MPLALKKDILAKENNQSVQDRQKEKKDFTNQRLTQSSVPAGAGGLIGCVCVSTVNFVIRVGKEEDIKKDSPS